MSGSDVAGEGEVKIIEWVHHVLGGMAGIKKDESIVVVGGDADLVLQGIATTHQDFFIYSGKDGQRKSDMCFSMWKVAKKLEETFPGQSDTVRTDLLVLLILNGNDYLPKMRGISFGLLYKAYKKVKSDPVLGKQSLIRGGSARTFNWQFLHALMRRVQRDRFVTPLTEAEIAKSTAASAAALAGKDYVSMLTTKAQKGKMELKWETSTGPGGGFIVSVAAVCGDEVKIAGASGEEERTIKYARQSASFDALVAAGELERGMGWWKESGRVGAQDADEEGADEGEGHGDDSISGLGIEEGGVGDWEEGDDDERSTSPIRSQSAGSMSDEDEDDDGDEEGDDEEDDDDEEEDEQEAMMSGEEESIEEEKAPVAAAAIKKTFEGKSRRGRRLYGEKEYFQGILWNIQMYIDGFCPNYQYIYPYKYAPDARAIASWIESQDYEPVLDDPIVPMSNKGALTPLEACVAMMPPGTIYPTPVDTIITCVCPLDRKRKIPLGDAI